jgi:hypothetical protein
VVAFSADQPAWGRTLERLGVSPATHRLPSVSAETLAISMGAIADNPSFRQRARELQQIRRLCKPASDPSILYKRNI